MEQESHTLVVDGEAFDFDLHRNPEVMFGKVAVDQWWMRVTQLYAQRQQSGAQEGNHRTVLEFYWAVCRNQDASRVRAAQERYLLGTLLPDMRSEGSRRIFADAFQARGTPKERNDQVRELNDLIAKSGNAVLTREEFHRQTWGLLGRPEFPEESQQRYDEMCAALFDDAYEHLERGDANKAHQSVQAQWDSWKQRIGRRAGHADEKVILDVLSYEARAAFHHCYSVVWTCLLYQLSRTHKLTEESAAFLKFWHQDWVDSSSMSQERALSLFHGHVFGLHPGPARFLLTNNGRQLMGNWLNDFESVTALQPLLHGLYVAIADYDSRRADTAEGRRGSTIIHAASDLDSVQEQQEERRRGHRPPRRRLRG